MGGASVCGPSVERAYCVAADEIRERRARTYDAKVVVASLTSCDDEGLVHFIVYLIHVITHMMFCNVCKKVTGIKGGIKRPLSNYKENPLGPISHTAP